jgi:hypothetical protein
VTALCVLPQAGNLPRKKAVPSSPPAELVFFVPMIGAEYLNASVIQALWQDLDSSLDLEFLRENADFRTS